MWKSKSKSKIGKALQIAVRPNNALNDVQNEMNKTLVSNPLDILKSDINSSFPEDFLQNISRISLLGQITPDPSEKSQNLYISFQRSFKLLVISGQIVGLNPVYGISVDDAAKVRFQKFSLKSLYSYFVCAFQGVAAILCLYKLFNSTVSVTTLAYVTFFGTTAITTVLFLNIAYKWPSFLRELTKMPLHEYVNPKVKLKCDVTVIIFTTLSALEHFLSLIARMAELSCNSDQNLFRKYIYRTCPWMKDYNLPYNTFFGVLTEIMILISSLNWNYSDLFIICISFYLISILEGINKKILITRGKYLPSVFWRSLREDYNRATRLVRYADDVVNGVILMSFASNLFFICIQIFNFLTNGTNHTIIDSECSNQIIMNGLLGGYEQTIYFSYSISWLFGRSLAMALIAAGVHSQTLVPAAVLYDVPSPVYCSEVQRFIEQLHGDTVALTGLQFFKVTKGLLLTVAGTIVTYELVLIQFNGEQMLHNN